MKYCSQCGTSNEDSAAFCAQCGARMEDTAPAAPVQPEPVAQQSSYEQPVYQTSVAPTSEKPAGGNSTLWLILNIVITVLCCFNLFGIIGIVMAAMAKSAAGKGDTEKAARNNKVAMIMFIVGIITGIISIITFIICMSLFPTMLGGMFDDMGYYY